jgi:hypothetical protein
MKINSTKTSKFVGIGDHDIYTIFRLHSSAYVWDPGGLYIDLQYSAREYYILRKGPVEIVHITAKGKLHLRHPETNELMKGWHTDKVRPYVLREVSVAPDEPDDSENL